MPPMMQRRHRRIPSQASDDDSADLDGLTAGGPLGAVEQRSGTGVLAGFGGGVGLFLNGISNDTIAHDPTVDSPVDDFIANILQKFGYDWNPAEGTLNGLEYDGYTDPGQVAFWIARSLELGEDFQQFGVILQSNPVLAIQYLVSLELFDFPTHIAEIVPYLASQSAVLAAGLGAAVAPVGAEGGFAGLAGLAGLPQSVVTPAPVAAAPSLLPVAGVAPITAPAAAAPASAPAPPPTSTASTVASSAPPPTPPAAGGAGFAPPTPSLRPALGTAQG